MVVEVEGSAIHVMEKLSDMICEKLTPPLQKQGPQELLKIFSDEFLPDEIIEAYDELFVLFQNGELFSEDDYQKFDSITSLSPVKALCLHVAHDCNMRCDYCFASTGDYQGNRSLLSVEVVKNAIDYLLKYSQG